MAFLSKSGEARIPHIVYLMLSTTSSSSEESFTTTAIPPPIAPALQAEVAMSSRNVLLRFREMTDLLIHELQKKIVSTVRQQSRITRL